MNNTPAVEQYTLSINYTLVVYNDLLKCTESKKLYHQYERGVWTHTPAGSYAKAANIDILTF